MAVERRARSKSGVPREPRAERELVFEEKLLAAMAKPDNGLFVDIRRNGDMLTARFTWSEGFKVKMREVVLCRGNVCYPGEFEKVLAEIASSQGSGASQGSGRKA